MTAPWIDHEGKEVAPPLPERCPLCDHTTTSGFGLAMGGYGPYVVCIDDDCPWFVKQRLPPKEAS